MATKMVLRPVGIILIIVSLSYAIIINNNGNGNGNDDVDDLLIPYNSDNNKMVHKHVNKNNDRIKQGPIFPEMDAKGFHEYVFDDQFTDVYGRGKKWTTTDDALNKLFHSFKSAIERQEQNRKDQKMMMLMYQSENKQGKQYYPFKNITQFASNNNNNYPNDSLPLLWKRKQFDRSTTFKKVHSTAFDDRDVFQNAFGHNLQKKALEMDSTGFYGDVFQGGFGNFDPLKKRSPEMDSSGFESDVFRGGFGSFDTLRKRNREMDSKGFHGDLFRDGFGKFDTLKKRKGSNKIIGWLYWMMH